MLKCAVIGAVIAAIFGQGLELASAQQVEFAPRDSIIFLTLNHMQEREHAVVDAMMEAQLKLTEIRAKKAAVKSQGKPKTPAHYLSRGLSVMSFFPKVHPYMALSSSYNSNVNNVEHNRKGEWSQQVVNGVRTNLFENNRSISLGLSKTDQYLDKTTKSNSQTGSASFVSNFNLGRFLLTFGDTFTTNYVATPETGVRIDLDSFQYNWSNAASFGLARHFNRFGFDVGYARSDSDIKRGTDTFGGVYTFSNYLRLAPKTRALFSYTHSRSRTKKSDIVTNGDSLNLSLTSIFSPKITAMVSFDYAPTDSKSSDDSLDRSFSDSVSYNLSTRTNLSFAHAHSISHSATDSSYSLSDNFSLNGNHRFAFNPKLNLSLGYSAGYTENVKVETYSNSFAWTLGLSYSYARWLDFSFQWQNGLSVTNSATDNRVGDNTLTFSSQARF